MALEFNAITFNPARERTNSRTLAWSRLVLAFKDTDADHHPSVELTLLQTTLPDTTISEIEREATDHAKTILREALSLLEAKNVTALLSEQAEKDAATQKKLDEWNGS